MKPMIHIINGPNLNLLGQRQPEIYGTATLADVERDCAAIGAEQGLGVTMLQSNHEGTLVDMIQAARQEASGIIINAAALTHTSVAVFDALNTFDGPVIEVHISNIHKREPFRNHSYVSARADGIIIGLGINGYALAMRHLCGLLAS
ncbi:MAG: type II 3-dehydroquinate dehydratase [Rhodobacteraceae bacterium]|nr:type II 3-dehydroquinate dehydratase [Paracoccaceae bacterium]